MLLFAFTTILALLFIDIASAEFTVNCGIPECRFLRARPYTQYTHNMNGERIDTRIRGLKLDVPLNSNSTKCWMNSTRIIDSYKFGEEPVYAIFSFFCENPINIYLTTDKRPYLSNILAYIQIRGCRIHLDEIFKLKSIFHVYVLNVINTTVPLEDVDCNGTQTNKTNCDLLQTVEALWMANTPHSQDKPLSEIFHCSEPLSNIKELKLTHWNLNEPFSFFMETFPNIQLLDISFSDLTIPPPFPWNDEFLSLSYNLSTSKAHHHDYALSFNLDLPNTHHKRALILESNNIKNLKDHRFSGLLQMIQISNNGLEEFSEYTFRGLKGFNHLDLSLNKLQKIPSKAFQGLKKLRHLSFHSNFITELQPDLFVENTELRYIDFSKNSISKIAAKAFENLVHLKELRLEFNKIVSIDRLMFPVTSFSFKFLHLDGNPMVDLPSAIFYLKALSIASFKNTQINFKNLTQTLIDINLSLMIDSTSNASSSNADDISFDEIKTVDLSGSQVDNIDVSYLDSKHITENERTLLQKKLSMILNHFRFLLRHNPIKCSCRINPISKIIKDMISDSSLLTGVDSFSDWVCQSPKEFQNKKLLKIPLEDTYCVKDVRGCPGNCTCYERSETGIIIVDCRRSGYIALPENLPDGPLDLWFQENNITLISHRNYLDRIRQFHLSYNSISKFTSGVFLTMSKLRSLHIDSNLLVSLPSELKHVKLSTLLAKNNPYKCDCNTHWMKGWLRSNISYVKDKNEMTCNADDKNEEGKQFVNVPDNDFICLEDFDSDKHVIIPSVAISVTCFLIIIAVCLTYVYRLEVKVLLYIYLGIHPFDLDDKDGRETVDVLIVHEPELTEWVMENIVTYLEFNSNSYVVCEMMRDFVAGFSYQENIASMVKHSKRIIVVLSQGFIESDLFKLAWNEAQVKIQEARANYAIIISKHINFKEIKDKDLQRYIKQGKYIDARHSLFQEKVLYSMPQYKGDTDRIKSLPDIKYCIQAMYENDDDAVETFERHAFLSYPEKETGYITNALKPTLEENGYSLCIPDIDFIPGAPKEENILKAIDNSLHTVFLLSGNHLDDEWSVFTFRSACEKSLRFKCNHLIVILREDTDMDSMDEEAKSYAKTHVTLTVGDKWFVRRLLNALPDITKHEPCKQDNGNFVKFHHIDENIGNGHKKVKNMEIEHDIIKNGYTKGQNGYVNGKIYLEYGNGEICREQEYHNHAFIDADKFDDIIDINDNERNK